MDLGDGQSFAIAGLVDNRVTQQLSKIPGSGRHPHPRQAVPEQFGNQEPLELLVVVTPHIVQPVKAATAIKNPVFPVPFMPPLAAEPAKPPAQK